MATLVLLDSGPLGLVTNPRTTPETDAASQWLASLPRRRMLVALPEIADYEVRRELIRAGRVRGLARLDALRLAVVFVPITSEVMLLAAQFWAEARQRGRPTADDTALDGDVILAAQAQVAAREGYEVVIATTNVGHLSHFADARHWRDVV